MMENQATGQEIEGSEKSFETSFLEPSLPPSGSQVNNKHVIPPRKEIVFFNSSDQLVRPKKRASFRKTRSKAQSQGRRSSPFSEERPKKRPRDNGAFSFDLNVDISDNSKGPDQDKGKLDAKVMRQVPVEAINKEQEIADNVFIPKKMGK
ncbi:hypothetical protein Hanom_Chr04g00370881 [Helianthus anomalus]